MNKKLFLSLSVLVMVNSFSVFAMTTEDRPQNRSLLGSFDKPKQNPAETLPTPPPVDTKALEFKPELTKEEEHEDPFASSKNSPFQHFVPTPKNGVSEKTSQKEVKQSASSSTKALTNTTESLPETAEQKAKKLALAKEEQEKDQLVRFYFEDASLENLVLYIEELFAIKFFVDDDLNPPPPGGALLKGNKITFKTNKPMTRDAAWTLFLKFLDMAGLSVVESQITGFYRITTVTNANKEVLPTFFNTSANSLPDNSLKVRYIFFVKNASLATIQTIVGQLASSTALVDNFPDLNAIAITDKAVNIRSLMKIVHELDKEMPEAMSILRLKKADATDVYNLYTDLTKTESPQGMARFFGQRAQPDSLYFPANARLIVEPRTNSLILLGPAKSLAKIEEFVTKYIDVELDMPYSPLYIYEVQYLNAANLATILTSVISFGQGSAAGTFGGVRNGNEYFGPINITAEPTGNRLVIKAEERDYKKLLPIIKEMDVLQPEVAIEVLIINVSSTDTKQIGSQIHNKQPNSPFRNVNFQTSGFPTPGGPSGPVVNATTGSLLGNLISLATGGTTGDGSTYMTIGDATNGVWGIFKALKSFSDTSIIANPFLLSTNNYAASVSVGTSRQVQTGSVISSQGPTASYDTLQANLAVNISPQISLDSSVQMSITVNLTDFSDSTNTASGNTFTKAVTTSVSVKNREIVVLGGLVKNQVTDVETKVPILGDIPLLGWLFKNKQKTTVKTNILIFISPRILTLKVEDDIDYYTLNKAQEAKDLVGEMSGPADKRDPLNRMFFGINVHDKDIGNFLDNDPHLKVTEEALVEKRTLQKRKKRSQELKKNQEPQSPEEKIRSPKPPRAGRFKRSEDLS
jgi:general secretion pathway protein D